MLVDALLWVVFIVAMFFSVAAGRPHHARCWHASSVTAQLNPDGTITSSPPATSEGCKP